MKEFEQWVTQTLDLTMMEFDALPNCGLIYGAWQAKEKIDAKLLQDSADKLHPPGAKRVNQYDRHVADVLRRHAEKITGK